MNRTSRGFGLIELLIALALSLVVVLGVAQVFISAKNTFVSQNAAANMQEDARFVLSKMIQEIRMVGMFGCLQIPATSAPANFITARDAPISWDNAGQKLTLVTADVGTSGGLPTWTVVSDCRTDVSVSAGARVLTQAEVAAGKMTFPIRQLVYTLKNKQLTMGVGTGTPSQYALIENVSAFSISFGVVGLASGDLSYSLNPADVARIRSVRLTLTLSDPDQRVRDQTFSVVAALRNRLP